MQGQLAALQAQHDAHAREAAALRQQLAAREAEREAGDDWLAALEAAAAAATDPASFLQLAGQCAQRMRQLQASLAPLLAGGGAGAAEGPQQAVMSVAVGRKQMGQGEAQALAQLMGDFQGVVGKLGQAAERLQQQQQQPAAAAAAAAPPAASTPSSATAAELVQRQGGSPRPLSSPRSLSDRGVGAAGYSEGDMSPGPRCGARRARGLEPPLGCAQAGRGWACRCSRGTLPGILLPARAGACLSSAHSTPHLTSV